MPRRPAVPKLSAKHLKQRQEAALRDYLATASDTPAGLSLDEAKSKERDAKLCNHDGPCKVLGTVRHISAWYCPDHVPQVASYCSHSLAPSGQCAYCGTVNPPHVDPRPCWVPTPEVIHHRPPHADAYLAALMAAEF